MSYIGYEEVLCQNGHLSVFDAHDQTYFRGWKCRCGSNLSFHHSVDQTNGDDDSVGPYPFKVKTEAVQFRCPSCGNEHVTQEATYYAPSQEEYDAWSKQRIEELEAKWYKESGLPEIIRSSR